jgi:hypothetical protein
VRTRHVIAFSAVALIAAACTSSTTTTGRPGYSVPLGRIVADANAQNQGNPFYRLAPPATKVPMSEATAARAVISECNEGRGTRVLVAGLVTGPVTSGSSIYWAVFVDPPGKHIAPSAEPLPKPVILNWIGGVRISKDNTTAVLRLRPRCRPSATSCIRLMRTRMQDRSPVDREYPLSVTASGPSVRALGLILRL